MFTFKACENLLQNQLLIGQSVIKLLFTSIYTIWKARIPNKGKETNM